MESWIILCLSLLILVLGTEGISICSSGEIQATEGEVTSPNFEPNSERTYPSDSDCTLAIDGGNNVKFKIKFEFFEVQEDEDGPDCTYDALKIVDGSRTSTYCGREIPPDYTSTGNKISIVFRSDSSLELKGFNISFSTFSVEPSGDCQRALDVCIILDSSSSVRRDNFETVKNFLIHLVDKMYVSYRMTHVGVIHYNHNSYLDWNFNSDVAKNAAALKNAIKKLKYQPGGTRTDKGLDLAAKEMFEPTKGERPDVPNVMLVFTDGKTSKRSKKYVEVLKPFVDKGVKIIAIGVGPSIDRAELIQIANGKEDNVVQVSEFSKLVSKIQEILKISCASRKLITK